MNIKHMKVLSVDDNETNLLLLRIYAEELELKIDSFTDPIKALENVKEKKYEYDLVLVDYNLNASIDGLEFITFFRKEYNDIPIVMITALGTDIELQTKALEYGATDFLSKPINKPIFKARITNLLSMRKNQLLLRNKTEFLENEVEKATKLIKEREEETLIVLGKTAEYKDPETSAHVSRVANYSKILAKKCGESEHSQNVLFYAAPFHDIGKVGIPDNILLKPGKLTPEEFEVMKTHTLIGFEILKSAKSEYLNAGGVIAFTHHEKWDGSGYPKGLKGELIPLYGRILAIVDVFDALSSKRPYKEAWVLERCFDYIKENSGIHFDPTLVNHFLELREDIEKIYKEIRE